MMGANSRISWTDHTQNWWRGCTKISPGCEYCYMFPGQRSKGLDPTRVVRTSKALWNQPARWHRQAAEEGRRYRIFASSWTDFFHPDADQWRAEAWQQIRETPNLIYQVLTKRPGRIAYTLPADWGDGYPNVLLGVSVE